VAFGIVYGRMALRRQRKSSNGVIRAVTVAIRACGITSDVLCGMQPND
jgi:hypothetical protein